MDSGGHTRNMTEEELLTMEDIDTPLTDEEVFDQRGAEARMRETAKRMFNVSLDQSRAFQARFGSYPGKR